MQGAQQEAQDHTQLQYGLLTLAQQRRRHGNLAVQTSVVGHPPSVSECRFGVLVDLVTTFHMDNRVFVEG